MQVCTDSVGDSSSHPVGLRNSNVDTAGIVFDVAYYVDVVFHSR